MSGFGSLLQVRCELCRAIQCSDTETVRRILSKNSEALKTLSEESFYSDVVHLLGPQTNKDMYQLFAKFLHNEDPQNQLKLAIFTANISETEWLLKVGAKIDTFTDHMKWMPRGIFYNIETRKQMLQLLLDHGLNVGSRNDQGDNFLHLFIHNYVKKDDQTAVEIAELLVNSGISVNATNSNLYTPLLLSIRTQNTQLISFLIDKGAHVDMKWDMGFSPLFIAAQCGYKNVFDLLVSKGAGINSKSSIKETTVLHEACRHDPREDIINFLIQRGAHVSTADKLRRTPLAYLRVKMRHIYRHVNGKEEYDNCVGAIVKEISKLKYENQPFCEVDMDIIQENPRARQQHHTNMIQLEEMSRTQFHSRYSYYSLLTKSICKKKLAKLLKNEEFISQFEAYLLRFCCYENDLRRIFYEAIAIRDEILAIESRLKYVFGDFLPEIVIKKLAEHLKIEDLPFQPLNI